ncbi:hypothetical protein BDA99DRAFT_565704 [Phascolomyces articulosus]|uniref:Uncharacterized protein n=1 Tax=Phascolomyces articulosus TaxID=60185 RepID=A0AAD5JX69_9FUNG|nr:hypothetical protein BDA99DRAFT_565704 [Phascolomyces articulosus]
MQITIPLKALKVVYNYENQESVLDFFRAGIYTAGQKIQAEGELIKSISILANRHDKRKLVLVAKAQINHYIQRYNLNSKQVPGVEIPIIQVLIVKMMANGLYTVELLHEFMLQVSIQSFKEDMSCLIKALSMLMELTKQLKYKLSDISKKQSPSNMPIKQTKKLEARPTAGTVWIREVMYDDSYDNENI